MKKTYIIPEMIIVRVAQTLLNPTSDPDAYIDKNALGAAPSTFEVKSNTPSYNVWDDDWSR